MRKKAFTLVELMVAMAIIGVLLGLAIYGVTAAQRAQRDTERKAALQDINIGIQDLIDQYGEQPQSINTTTDPAKAVITGTNTTSKVTVTLKNSAKGAARTSTSNTHYYFETCTSGYYLAACLEANTTPYPVGTCSSSTTTMVCP